VCKICVTSDVISAVAKFGCKSASGYRNSAKQHRGHFMGHPVDHCDLSRKYSNESFEHDI